MSESTDQNTANVRLDLSQFEGHTPGPWRTAEGQPYDDEGSHLDIIDANGVLVTETSYFTDMLHPNARPNARLIAAAPDLLAALRELLDAIHWEPFSEDDTTLEIDRAVAERIMGKTED